MLFHSANPYRRILVNCHVQFDSCELVLKPCRSYPLIGLYLDSGKNGKFNIRSMEDGFCNLVD